MKEDVEKNKETIENDEPVVENDTVEEQPSAEETIQQLGEKLEAIDDKYKRLYAEYENYRKRTNLEKADLLINGSRETIKSILPIIDDMERALNAMSDDEGVRLIYNKLVKILQQKGLKEMEVMGERFDENLHEAVTRIPATDEEQKGVVIDVVEKGYFLNDKVLRYAKVVVAC
ncbi:MAG: nucleotide exchange factor GrpE [Bacteroidales bacterium]|nr:nucleotide exchange factor GrpE [Bacteroidales bacterium]MBR1799853.1 nucleotide exchange factor GrpE [Bacteroidales bacterium]MBR1850713.1 nucleotide exchange factor GrpE [Bacteroidales bacterium]